MQQDFLTNYSKRLKKILVDSQGNQIDLPGVGDVLGKLQIDKVIGTGAMGMVCKATETDLEVKRAVKIPLLESTLRDLSYFRTEAKICAKLDHPNIVKVFSTGLWKDALPYAEMEFVDGKNLTEMIKEQGKLPVPFALAIIAQICAALEYAYSQSIVIDGKEYANLVHRDIKPSNILVSNRGCVKLTDFGLARFETEKLSHSVNGLIVGTLPYIAPECHAGGKANMLSDVYALGVTLYEMITGVCPFYQEDIEGISKTIAMKQNSSYRPLHELVPGIDSAVCKVIDRCLVPHPTRRYNHYSVLRFRAETTLENYTDVKPEELVTMFVCNHKNYSILTSSKIVKEISLYSKKTMVPLTIIASALLLLALILYIKPQKYFQPLLSHDTLESKAGAKESILDKNKSGVVSDDSSKSAETKSNKEGQQDSKNESWITGTEKTVMRQITKTPVQISIDAYRNNNYAEVIINLEKVDFKKLVIVQYDSCVIILLESYLKSSKIREALAFGLKNPVNDGKYYLLMAICQNLIGIDTDAQKSFDRAVDVPSQFDSAIKRKALLHRARYYQKRYELLRTEQMKTLSVQNWKEFISRECNNPSSECDEGRRAIGE
jgi:serine/threonine protein kinase